MKSNTAPHEAFGSCPDCHQIGDLVNIGAEQFAVCHDHKVGWHICSMAAEDATPLGDPDSVADYAEVEPHFEGADDDEPEEKSVHASMKERRANIGRRLGTRAK